MNDMEKKVADENIASSESSKEFEFITETIKKRPINMRKIVKKVLFTVFLAVIFGIVSSITLIILYPRLQKKFYPKDDTRPVTLPVASEEVVEEKEEEFVLPKSDTEEPSEEKETSADDAQPEDGQDEVEDELKEADTKIPGNESQEEQPSEEEQNIVIDNVVETVEKSLELDDYKSLLRKISAVATSTQKSLVTVSARKANVDWFNNSYENNNSTTGLIVAENGKELLIIAPTEILNNATYVDVTFCDEKKYPATVRKSDKNTGLSVVAVQLANIEEDTMSKVEFAQFGSISALSTGIPVVAVGSLYGTAGSSGFGQITSEDIVVDKTDSNVRIISTDIYGSTKSTGVLVNFNGRIVGIICHEGISPDMPNLVHAYSITDITDIIEKISNGQSVVCLGIIGTDVTDEASNELGVPKGAYVKEVVLDSPAMDVGIRNGDIIEKIDDKSIGSFTEYKSILLNHNVGDLINITLKRPVGDHYTDITYEITLEALQ